MKITFSSGGWAGRVGGCGRQGSDDKHVIKRFRMSVKSDKGTTIVKCTFNGHTLRLVFKELGHGAVLACGRRLRAEPSHQRLEDGLLLDIEELAAQRQEIESLRADKANIEQQGIIPKLITMLPPFLFFLFCVVKALT